ncbi:MAG: TonB-dependent receptor [bacterium]
MFRELAAPPVVRPRAPARPRRAAATGAPSRLIGVLLLAALAATSRAQDDPLGGSGGADESVLFGEIPSVQTASRYAQRVGDAPSAVSVITSDEIWRFGYRNLAEVLARLPGFYTTYDRNYVYLGVRGFSGAGDYNCRILLLVDGHRLNNPIYDQAPLSADFPVDLSLIDRIEVVRGPASSLYGTSAFFGVVNVITRRGRDLAGAEPRFEWGSHASYAGRLAAGAQSSSGLEALVAGSVASSEGRASLEYSAFDDPSTANGTVRDADGGFIYHLYGKGSYHDFTLSAGHGSSDKTLPTSPFDTVFPTDRNRTRDQYAWMDLDYRPTEIAGFTPELRVVYDWFRYNGRYLYAGPEEDPSDTSLWLDDADSQRVGAEIQLSKMLFDAHRVVVGAENRTNFRIRQHDGDEGEPLTLDDRRETVDWGLFAQDEFHVTPWLILNAGLRFDAEVPGTSRLSPRVAVIARPFDPTTVKLIYGEAFRAANAYELHYADGITQKPPGHLSPETIRQVELVAEQSLSEHLELSGSIYHYSIDDLVTLTSDESDGLLVYRNAASVSALGAELRLIGRFDGGAQVELGYGLQRATDETDVSLADSPENTLVAAAAFPIVGDALGAAVQARYLSPRKTRAGASVAAAYPIDVTLTSRRWLGGLAVAATVRNVLDQHYADPVTDELRQDRIPQDGRTFWLNLSYELPWP